MALAGAVVAVAAVRVTLSVAGAGPFQEPGQVTGVGINTQDLPEGALRYLDANGIDGRLYNTFQWGGYIAWRDFPRRVPIVDGRGWVPSGMLEEIAFARQHPVQLDALATRYGIDVAVVDYPHYVSSNAPPGSEATGGGALGPATDVAFTSPAWALVYWDDAALVYLRRAGRFAALVARDEYRHIKPGNVVGHIAGLVADRQLAPAVVAELQRNLSDTGSALGATLLGHVAVELGAHDQGIPLLERGRTGRTRLDAEQGLALAYWRKGDIARARQHYETILAAAEQPVMRYNAALAAVRTGDDDGALRHLIRARRASPDFDAVHTLLVDIYRRRGDAVRGEEVRLALEAAVQRQRADEQFRTALRLREAGRPGEARAALASSLALRPRHALALTTLGELELDDGHPDRALALLGQALGADPTLARAHYVLARVHRQRGDEAAARRAYAEFVRLVPRSYLAWQVRTELARSEP
jgi:tetratricopeptide (TPR) repeat protein